MQFTLPKVTFKNAMLAFIAVSVFIALWPMSPFLAAIAWIWKKTDYSRTVKIIVTVLLAIVTSKVLPPSNTQNTTETNIPQQTAQNAPGEANAQPSNEITTSTQTAVVAQNSSPQRDVNAEMQATSTAPTQPQTVTNTAPVQQPPNEPAVTLYIIASVIDGDTLKITMNGKLETLRLIGMDTPETTDPRKPVQCFGKEASNKAKELLVGKKISIEVDPSQGERDKYGRLLVYVRRSDGLFYNKYMIEQGFAHEYTYNLPYKYQAEFKAAQKEAQAAQRGLWSPTTCNGDTTKAATSPTPTTQTQNAPSPAPTTQTQPAPVVSNEPVAVQQPQSSGKFYTSSHYSATYYYPEACEGWKTLSTRYLKTFDSLKALLAAYPSRTLSPQCN